MSNAVWLPRGTNVRLYCAVLVILPKYSLSGIIACRKKFMASHTWPLVEPQTLSQTVRSGQREANCEFISVCKLSLWFWGREAPAPLWSSLPLFSPRRRQTDLSISWPLSSISDWSRHTEGLDPDTVLHLTCLFGLLAAGGSADIFGVATIPFFQPPASSGLFSLVVRVPAFFQLQQNSGDRRTHPHFVRQRCKRL